MANITLARRDTYLDHLRSGIKLDTLASLGYAGQPPKEGLRPMVKTTICERCFLCISVVFCPTCQQCPHCCSKSAYSGQTASVLGNMGCPRGQPQNYKNPQGRLHPPFPELTELFTAPMKLMVVVKEVVADGSAKGYKKKESTSTFRLLIGQSHISPSLSPAYTDPSSLVSGAGLDSKRTNQNWNPNRSSTSKVTSSTPGRTGSNHPKMLADPKLKKF